MPTFAEQIAATNAKLDALIAGPPPPAPPAPEELKLTPAEALATITAELNKSDTTPDRATYLKSVLAEIAKSHWEATSFIQLKVLHDPLLQVATTTVTPVANASTGPAATGFSSNAPLTGMAKAQEMQKLIVDRDALKKAIEKSRLTDKMAEIKTVFQIADTEMESEYDLRWKIGDIVDMLQKAIKLEQFVGDPMLAPVAAPYAPPGTTPPTPTSFTANDKSPWPADMAKAKFDDKEGLFKAELPSWGRDGEKA